jgi:DNA invertase Pin-like site-specific DNA recombinase
VTMAKRKTKPGDSSVAVAYLRVSTDDERQELGLEAQRQAVESWAASNGVRVVEWFTELVSGSAPLDKRLVLIDALAAVAAHGAGHLVVQRLDRFSRDPVSAGLAEAELQRNGALLAVALGGGSGDDPTAELVRGILLSVARFELRMTKARIRAALAVKKRRGERTGSCPFGFQTAPDGKTLEENPAEQTIVEEIECLRSQGRSSRSIVAELSAQGVISPRSGKPLTQTAVVRVLATLRAQPKAA